jgi:Flp pilus assembly protein TadG
MKRLPDSTASRTQRSRGATAVEFALIAPLFFLFVLGFFEFTRGVMVQQALSNSAREGCRLAALATTMSQTPVEAKVRQYLQGVVPGASSSTVVTVTVSPALAGITPGTAITTTVQVPYSSVSWLPLGSVSFLNGATLRASSTMERE